MTTTASITRRSLQLSKGEHSFHFRYEPGEETQVLDALSDFATRRQGGFDWFDAAVLSHQLGQQLSKEMRTFWPKEKA